MTAAFLALALAAPPPRVVVLVPLGPVEPGLLEVARVAIEARVDAAVRVAEPRALPERAFYVPRRRWRAERILDALEAEAPDGAWRVVGVTEAEISTTKGQILDWGIAGLGSIDGRACVLSSYLYKKHSRTRAALERRFADIVVHEFGHTLGLDHCEVSGCVMANAKGKAIRSADRSAGEYCLRCRARVERAVLRDRPWPRHLPPQAPPCPEGEWGAGVPGAGVRCYPTTSTP